MTGTTTGSTGSTDASDPTAAKPARLGERRDLTRSTTATDVALVATFAALLAVCSILPAITVGVVPVPITLQTFAVLLCGAILGPWRGLLAVLLYFAVGVAGVPVFSMGVSGLVIFTGVSAGYAVSFPLAAVVVGLLVRLVPARAGQTLRSVLVMLACAAATAAVVYPLGIAGMMWRADLSFGAAFTANAAFVPADLVKCVAVGVVATAVLRAFPTLAPVSRRRG